PFQPFLPVTGYVVFLEPAADNEPNPSTLSDILVSYTGSSLQLFSDGSNPFPPDLSGLQQLGQLVETGGPMPVGHFFGIGDNQIVVTSDIPEPGTLALLAIGAASLIGYAWRRRRRA